MHVGKARRLPNVIEPAAKEGGSRFHYTVNTVVDWKKFFR